MKPAVATFKTPGSTAHLSLGPRLKPGLASLAHQRTGLDTCKAGWAERMAQSASTEGVYPPPKATDEVVGHTLPTTDTLSRKGGCGGECGCGGTCDGKEKSSTACGCQHEVDYKVPGMGCGCGSTTAQAGGGQETPRPKPGDPDFMGPVLPADPYEDPYWQGPIWEPPLPQPPTFQDDPPPKKKVPCCCPEDVILIFNEKKKQPDWYKESEFVKKYGVPIRFVYLAYTVPVDPTKLSLHCEVDWIERSNLPMAGGYEPPDERNRFKTKDGKDTQLKKDHDAKTGNMTGGGTKDKPKKYESPTDATGSGTPMRKNMNWDLWVHVVLHSGQACRDQCPSKTSDTFFMNIQTDDGGNVKSSEAKRIERE